MRTDVRSCVCVRAFVMSTSLVKRSTNLRLLYCNYSTSDREAENCDERVRLCVCVCVCVFVCPRSYLRNCTSDLYQIFMHVTYGRGSVLIWRQIRYVLPVLWMTLYLLISQGWSTSPPAEAQCTRSLGLVYKLCAVIPVAGQRTHRTT